VSEQPDRLRGRVRPQHRQRPMAHRAARPGRLDGATWTSLGGNLMTYP
jgi:hypothetical protein